MNLAYQLSCSYKLVHSRDSIDQQLSSKVEEVVEDDEDEEQEEGVLKDMDLSPLGVVVEVGEQLLVRNS